MMDRFAECVPKDAQILDFGCGYGRTMSELAEVGYTRLTGIDFSESLVKRARRENPSFDVTAYPGGELPYEDDLFDAAVVMGVFTCIIETQAQAQALLELKRVLRPGGILAVGDFLINRDRRNLDRYKAGKEKYGLYGVFDVEDGGTLRHHDRNHMEALFSGFETLFFEEAIYETMHGNQSQGFFCLLRMP